MGTQYKIDLFVPPQFQHRNLDVARLEEMLGKRMLYASLGRYALLHILRSQRATGKVLIPVYICSSILKALRALRLSPVFYDLDEQDLNASIDSIDFLSRKYDVRFLLVASMYGNPSNLVEIEGLCRSRNIRLIDDAAQSFGATLADRFVGTFGNGGFISFAPGKPLAGHMGAFFWSDQCVDISRRRHWFIHYLKWVHFNYYRLRIYDTRRYSMLGHTLLQLIRYLEHITDISNDDICEFEKKILGGVLEAQLGNQFKFRDRFSSSFASRFEHNGYFRVLRSARGEPSCHKIVLIANESGIASSLSTHLRSHGIYAYDGYEMLSWDLKYLGGARKMDGRIIELPIEDSVEKMGFMSEVLQSYKA